MIPETALAAVPIEGSLVRLRDAAPADLERYLVWRREGDWLDFDAPWEHADARMTDEEVREQFTRQFLCEPSLPRRRLLIALADNRPIGWVNRYADQRFSTSCHVGIDICENIHLGHGCGTEALSLWVGHMFATSRFHRVACATYSFNARAIHVIEKVGFTREGRDREIVHWQDQWLDRLHFGLLRSEWESQPGKRT